MRDKWLTALNVDPTMGVKHGRVGLRHCSTSEPDMKTRTWERCIRFEELSMHAEPEPYAEDGIRRQELVVKRDS